MNRIVTKEINCLWFAKMEAGYLCQSSDPLAGLFSSTLELFTLPPYTETS